MASANEFDRLAAELEALGWQKEAALVRRFPRAAWNDELLKGMFVAATNVRDLKRAEKIAQRMVAFAPDNPFAHLALCLVKLRQGAVEEAARAFDRACHFASSLPTYRAQKIHWLCLQGKITDARKLLRETVKEFADRWEVQRAQAHVWLAEGRVEPAVAFLKQLARRHPNDPFTHALLAQGLLQAGRRHEAFQHLQLMAKHLPPVTFTDQDAFLAHALAKQALALWQKWLRPNWWWERWWLRWLPPHYFVAIGTFWFAVAILLAVLKLLLPSQAFIAVVGAAVAAFLYNRCADLFVLWRLRR